MTTPIIVFPDPENLLVAYLQNALDNRGHNIPVATTVPQTRNGTPVTRFVRVRLLGGSLRSLVLDEPTFAFETHDLDEEAAGALAALVRALIPAAVDVPGTPINSTTEISRPQNLPDPVSGNPRYSQSHQFTIRGTAA